MSLTKRIFIQWGNAEPSEATETLVLTSPGQQYVDIRVLKEDSNSATWAFCGKKKQKEDGTTVYTHEIDSLGQDIDDAGHFERLEGGDLKETGEMLNAETNQIEKYIELWRPMNPETVPLEPLNGNTPSPFTAYQVSERAEDGKLTGMVIRVGNWIQGIQLSKIGKVEFVRAHFSFSNVQVAKVVSCSGTFSSAILQNKTYHKGTELEDGWKVTESHV